MTRNQALELMPNYRNYGEQAIKGWLLDSLEQLKLIKFDRDDRFHRFGITRDNLEALDKGGYEIVEKKK